MSNKGSKPDITINNHEYEAYTSEIYQALFDCLIWFTWIDFCSVNRFRVIAPRKRNISIVKLILSVYCEIIVLIIWTETATLKCNTSSKFDIAWYAFFFGLGGRHYLWKMGKHALLAWLLTGQNFPLTP